MQLNAYKGLNWTHFRISLHIFDNVHTSDVPWITLILCSSPYCSQFLTVRCELYQICAKKSWSEFNQILCRHSIAPKLAKYLSFEVCQPWGLVLQCEVCCCSHKLIGIGKPRLKEFTNKVTEFVLTIQLGIGVVQCSGVLNVVAGTRNGHIIWIWQRTRQI